MICVVVGCCVGRFGPPVCSAFPLVLRFGLAAVDGFSRWLAVRSLR